MRRRQVLAGGAALLSVPLAGCGHPPVVLDMDEATAADIANQVSLRADPESAEYAVVASALENGTATRTGRYELFDSPSRVQFNGTVYDVTETRLRSDEATVYEILIDLDPADTTPELGVIEYDDLPEVDRQRLGGLLSEESIPQQEGTDIGIEYGSVADVGDESVFVPDPQYDILVYAGDRYRVTVNSRTTTDVEYQYSVTEVAPTVAAFAESVRAQYLFRLTGLSAAERDVVEKAIESGYFSDDEAFQSVIDRIRAHEGLDTEDSYGTWLLEYDGVEYLAYAEW